MITEKKKRNEYLREATFNTICRQCRQIAWCNFQTDPCKKFASYKNTLKKLTKDQLALYVNETKDLSQSEIFDLFSNIINIKLNKN